MLFVICLFTYLIYNLIDNRYHLRKRFHDPLNKKLRLTIIVIGLFLAAISIGIGMLPDEYLIRFHLNKDIVSWFFIIPILFIVLVGLPNSNDK